MLIGIHTLRHEVQDSPRRRQFDCWWVQGYPANNPDITIYRLVGITTHEVDSTEPPARLTRTSPITACKGNIVTTASGSKYYLSKNPKNGQEIHSPEQYIADEFLNPWIEGDNWLTI